MEQFDGRFISNNSNQHERNNTERSVEDITNQINRMNVDMIHVVDSNNESNLYNKDSMMEESMMITQQEDSCSQVRDLTHRQHPHHQQAGSCSNILIVTNVDSSVFYDTLTQQKFEALFLAYDPNITFRYLKSFRRVRVDFTSSYAAELARSNLSQYKLGNTEFRCYPAQIIRPNNNSNFNNNCNNDIVDEDSSSQMLTNSMYLNIPKLTKQFLISPPASPPVGWEPVSENSPCIDVQLMSAIANLVPGQVHEIHPASESQPGIFVEVCEEPQFESAKRSSSKTIPRTMSPGCCQWNHDSTASRTNEDEMML